MTRASPAPDRPARLLLEETAHDARCITLDVRGPFRVLDGLPDPPVWPEAGRNDADTWRANFDEAPVMSVFSPLAIDR
jgi:hypothetical protein